MNKKLKEKSGGYVAISSVLVILAVVLTITLSSSLLSIDGAQVALSESQSQSTVSIIDSCVADVLLFLNNNNSLPTSVALPEGSCTVAQDSNVDDNWVFTVTGTIDGYSRSIQVDVDRTTTLTINSWEEV